MKSEGRTTMRMMMRRGQEDGATGGFSATGSQRRMAQGPADLRAFVFVYISCVVLNKTNKG